MNVLRVKPSTHSGRLESTYHPRRHLQIAQPGLRQQREKLPADEGISARPRLERDEAFDRSARIAVIRVEEGRTMVALDDRERTARLEA